MPFPFLIPAALAALGIGTHLSAKEKNEKAQETISQAKRIYEAERRLLDEQLQKTEKTIYAYGEYKKSIFDSNIKEFVELYSYVKDIKLNDIRIDENIRKYLISENETLQLVQMSDIYDTVFTSSISGMATGTVVALALNGSLPLVTGTLSIAGSSLLLGEIGVATSLAGSALSFGAAMTPLSAFIAPITLFTGVSSSIKADENLEKAIKYYSEAEVAVEQMKNSEELCKIIDKKTIMYYELLKKLNYLLSVCNKSLKKMIKKKTRFSKDNSININKLNKRDVELIAVTRSLAGAIKALIDAPILEDGLISKKGEECFESINQKLDEFNEEVVIVTNNKVQFSKNSEKKSRKKHTFKYACIFILIIVLLFGVFASPNSDAGIDNSGNDNINSEVNQSSNDDITNLDDSNQQLLQTNEDTKDNSNNNNVGNTDNISSDNEDDNNVLAGDNTDEIENDNLIIDNIIATGKINDNISWELNSDGVLNLLGAGELVGSSSSFSCIKDISSSYVIKKVILGEGITIIGQSAFSNEYFDEIILPKSLKEIQNAAFTNSRLKSIDIPTNVDYIGHEVFTYCTKLTDVIIRNSHIKIEKYTFDNSPSITICGEAGSDVEKYASDYCYNFNVLN